MKIRKVSKRMLAGLLCLSLLAGLFPGLQLVPVADGPVPHRPDEVGGEL